MPDGVVGSEDLQELLENQGPCEDLDDCPWDFNDDDVVDDSDLLDLLNHFGPCP